MRDKAAYGFFEDFAERELASLVARYMRDLREYAMRCMELDPGAEPPLSTVEEI